MKLTTYHTNHIVDVVHKTSIGLAVTAYYFQSQTSYRTALTVWWAYNLHTIFQWDPKNIKTYLPTMSKHIFTHKIAFKYYWPFNNYVHRDKCKQLVPENKPKIKLLKYNGN